MNLLVIESNREVSEMLDALFYALVTELNALQRCVRLILFTVIVVSCYCRPAPAKSASLY